jgi:uncharacterized protein YjbJ (UPF0337 family)
MNTTTNVNAMIEKNWTELKGKIKSKWSKFNDEEVESVKSDLSQLSGKIQKAYGIAKDQAEHQYDEFRKSVQTLTGQETPVPVVAAVATPGPVPAKDKLN